MPGSTDSPSRWRRASCVTTGLRRCAGTRVLRTWPWPTTSMTMPRRCCCTCCAERVCAASAASGTTCLCRARKACGSSGRCWAFPAGRLRLMPCGPGWNSGSMRPMPMSRMHATASGTGSSPNWRPSIPRSCRRSGGRCDILGRPGGCSMRCSRQVAQRSAGSRTECCISTFLRSWRRQNRAGGCGGCWSVLVSIRLSWSRSRPRSTRRAAKSSFRRHTGW